MLFEAYTFFGCLIMDSCFSKAFRAIPHSFKDYLGYYIMVKPTFCPKITQSILVSVLIWIWILAKKELHYDIVNEIVFIKHKTLSTNSKELLLYYLLDFGLPPPAFPHQSRPWLDSALLRGPSIQNKWKMTGKWSQAWMHSYPSMKICTKP